MPTNNRRQSPQRSTPRNRRNTIMKKISSLSELGPHLRAIAENMRDKTVTHIMDNLTKSYNKIGSYKPGAGLGKEAEEAIDKLSDLKLDGRDVLDSIESESHDTTNKISHTIKVPGDQKDKTTIGFYARLYEQYGPERPWKALWSDIQNINTDFNELKKK